MYQDKEEAPHGGASFLLPGAFPVLALSPLFLCGLRSDPHKGRGPGAARKDFAGPCRSCAKQGEGVARRPEAGATGRRQGALSASTEPGLPPNSAARCAKRPFGEAPLLRYNARLACLHLQRDAGGRPGWRGIQLPARGDGISYPPPGAGTVAGGFPGEAWDRPPAPGGSSQPGGQGEGGEAARSAAAGSSGFGCRKHGPGAGQSARRRGWRGRKARHGAAGQQEGGPSNRAALLLCCSPLGG